MTTILRLSQSRVGEDRFRVAVNLLRLGKAQRSTTCEFRFALGESGEQDLRWYLERYLQNPSEPAPAQAREVEARLEAVGTGLFRELFGSSEDGCGLWARVRDDLADPRVEVVTGVAEAASILRELLRDPQTGEPLALTARCFVRGKPDATRELPELEQGGPIRVLLVICRPGGRDDVPFRSVASRLIKSLGRASWPWR